MVSGAGCVARGGDVDPAAGDGRRPDRGRRGAGDDTAGQLPAKHVIHVPTMEEPGMKIGAENVRRAARAALIAADRNGFRVIAIPGIGTDLGDVPDRRGRARDRRRGARALPARAPRRSTSVDQNDEDDRRARRRPPERAGEYVAASIRRQDSTGFRRLRGGSTPDPGGLDPAEIGHARFQPGCVDRRRPALYTRPCFAATGVTCQRGWQIDVRRSASAGCSPRSPC